MEICVSKKNKLKINPPWPHLVYISGCQPFWSKVPLLCNLKKLVLPKIKKRCNWCPLCCIFQPAKFAGRNIQHPFMYCTFLPWCSACNQIYIKVTLTRLGSSCIPAVGDHWSRLSLSHFLGLGTPKTFHFFATPMKKFLRTKLMPFEVLNQIVVVKSKSQSEFDRRLTRIQISTIKIESISI